MSTRSYEQRLRAQRAEATRRRILDAVYARLREAPTQPVGLDRVARMAGVSRSPVYLIFGSRAGLFDALGSDLLDRGGFEQVLDAAANPDARASVREGIGAVVRMYASERDVVRVLHSMATLDPDAVGGAIQRMERRRASGIAQQAQRLADDKLLRPDVTAEEAADLLWVLTSFDSFDQLYTGRALSTDKVAATLATTAERSLCQ